jgi:hypothetical protein
MPLDDKPWAVITRLTIVGNLRTRHLLLQDESIDVTFFPWHVHNDSDIPRATSREQGQDMRWQTRFKGRSNFARLSGTFGPLLKRSGAEMEEKQTR